MSILSLDSGQKLKLPLSLKDDPQTVSVLAYVTTTHFSGQKLQLPLSLKDDPQTVSVLAYVTTTHFSGQKLQLPLSLSSVKDGGLCLKDGGLSFCGLSLKDGGLSFCGLSLKDGGICPDAMRRVPLSKEL